ncbi:unnamed protein product, partial [marine sediment metagenome]
MIRLRTDHGVNRLILQEFLMRLIDGRDVMVLGHELTEFRTR